MLQSPKVKLAYKLKNGDKERLKLAFSNAIAGLQTGLQITRRIAGGVGLGPPGLYAGLSGLLLVVNAIQKTFQNAADIEQLAMRIRTMSSALQKSHCQGKLSPPIIARIEQLSEGWKDDIEELHQLASRNFAKRLFRNHEDAKAISDRIEAITWRIQNLTVESVLAVEFTLDVHTRFMKHAVGKIQSQLYNVGVQMESSFQQLNSRLDVKDGYLPHVSSARFDCGDRVPCLNGTRIDIIDQIYHWIGQNCDAELGLFSANTVPGDAVAKSRLFWINGSAGTGKTTIAYTVAKDCHQKGILGASFFCSRDDAASSNSNLIFPTIAYQLGYFCPSFRNEIARILKSHPDIGYSDLSYQLEQLIVNPLLAVGDSFPSCVVVIDALDECKDDRTTSLILASLSRYVNQLSPLKVLITSRPEWNILTGFESSPLNAATQRFVLHEVQLGVVQNDIKSYLAAELAAIRKFYHLHDSWPSTIDIEALSCLSSGLFIFAATSIKFIGDANYGDPAGQLTKLLQGKAVMDGSSPHHRLDQLYMQVLNHAYPDISSDLAGRIKTIVGSIIVLRDPLSARNLERLLNMNSENEDSCVQTTLIHLHSIVILPEDDTQVIRLLHPSFFDFLINPDRCLHMKLVVNTEAQHTLLAHACLHAMRDLRQNMCGIETPIMPQNKVANLSVHISRYISPHLQYACRHWASHLRRAMVSDLLVDLLNQFCSRYILYWVEICSVLGDLRNLLLSLDNARKALATSIHKTSDIMILLSDCERFVRDFFPILSTSPHQVYHSALMFTPRKALLRQKYVHELPTTRMHNKC